MRASIYVQSDAYHHAIDKLEAIARSFDPADPNDLRTMLIQVLGEDLNVWPHECARPLTIITNSSKEAA